MSYFPVSCSLYYYLLLAFICALRVLMNTMWTRLASLLYPFSFLLSHYWCHNCPRQLWPNFPPYMPPPPLRWKFPVAPSPLHTSSSPLLGPGRQMIELNSPPLCHCISSHSGHHHHHLCLPPSHYFWDLPNSTCPDVSLIVSPPLLSTLDKAYQWVWESHENTRKNKAYKQSLSCSGGCCRTTSPPSVLLHAVT